MYFRKELLVFINIICAQAPALKWLKPKDFKLQDYLGHELFCACRRLLYAALFISLKPQEIGPSKFPIKKCVEKLCSMQ
jgi:hypothetical protein